MPSSSRIGNQTGTKWFCLKRPAYTSASIVPGKPEAVAWKFLKKSVFFKMYYEIFNVYAEILSLFTYRKNLVEGMFYTWLREWQENVDVLRKSCSKSCNMNLLCFCAVMYFIKRTRDNAFCFLTKTILAVLAVIFLLLWCHDTNRIIKTEPNGFYCGPAN